MLFYAHQLNEELVDLEVKIAASRPAPRRQAPTCHGRTHQDMERTEGQGQSPKRSRVHAHHTHPKMPREKPRPTVGRRVKCEISLQRRSMHEERINVNTPNNGQRASTMAPRVQSGDVHVLRQHG